MCIYICIQKNVQKVVISGFLSWNLFISSFDLQMWLRICLIINVYSWILYIHLIKRLQLVEADLISEPGLGAKQTATGGSAPST